MPSVCLRQPTCPGFVDEEDGYCDTCGAPTAPAEATPADTPCRPRVQRPPLDITRLTSTDATVTPRASSQVGEGIVYVEPARTINPEATIRKNLVLPVDRRRCTNCLQPADPGSTHPAPSHNQCEHCGTWLDWRPPLLRSDTGEPTVVGDGYEVTGALSYGGMGWVYLAQQRSLKHWRVLKGLLDPTDHTSLPEQIAIERGYLKDLAHPGIVSVIDLPVHKDQAYLAMEYVNGYNLDQIATSRGGRLPVTTAAAYVLATLPALAYLHRRDLIFCDLKPENIIHTGDAVQLIDIGGVWKINSGAEVHGTWGFVAPEVANGAPPTVASDLYTVGRTLAVLALQWPDHGGDSLPWVAPYGDRLPAPDEEPLLAEHDCLWRFLQRACARNPADRFQSADEMADDLRGVLSQVAAAVDRTPRPFTSGRWEAPHPTLDRLNWLTLPQPHLPNQPGRPNRIAGLTTDPDLIMWVAAELQDQLSWGDAALAAATTAAHRPGDDRAYELASLLQRDGNGNGYISYISAASAYIHGMIALGHGDIDRMCHELDRAYTEAPGEPVCGLACAMALETVGEQLRTECEQAESGCGRDEADCELAQSIDGRGQALCGRGQTDEAAHLYLQVAATDPTWSSAVAGLARCLNTLSRPNDAAHVLADTIPAGHPLRAESLTLACRYMAEGHYDQEIADSVATHLTAAAQHGEPNAADAALAVELYSAALHALDRPADNRTTTPDDTRSDPGVDTMTPNGPTSPVNGIPPTRSDLADAAARALGNLADATPNRDRKHQLLDQATRTRTWRWW